MGLTGQWADSLLGLERLYFLKIVVWGALSILGSSGVVAWLVVSRQESRLLRRFAHVTLACGTVALVLGSAMRAAAELRSLAAAVALDRWLVFSIGLGVGLVLVGVTLVLAATRSSASSRPGMAGAGIAVIVQALAFAVFALQLSAGIVR